MSPSTAQSRFPDDSSASVNPPPYIVSPSVPHVHDSTLILLHGTSQTGESLASQILNFPIPVSAVAATSTTTTSQITTSIRTQTLTQLLPTTRFVFPTGSPKTLTVLSLPTSNSWFDIHSFADRTLGEEIQAVHLARSIAYLSSFISAEIQHLVSNGSSAKKLVLLGFSSGAAVVSTLLLSGVVRERVGAYIGLSGWLPFKQQVWGKLEGLERVDGIAGEDGWRERRQAARRFMRGLLPIETKIGTEGKGADDDGEGEGIEAYSRDNAAMEELENVPILYLHGMEDGKVKPEWCREKVQVLKNGLGLDVRVKEYQGLGHAFGGEELSDLVGFLKSIWAECKDGGVAVD